MTGWVRRLARWLGLVPEAEVPGAGGAGVVAHLPWREVPLGRSQWVPVVEPDTPETLEMIRRYNAAVAERAANPPAVRSGEMTGFSLEPGYVSPALKAALDMERLQRDVERRASGLEMG